MLISPGYKLGPYEILAPLGAGGMGEVYRARDSKLNREVAIKVLPSGLSDDAQYMARFEREAQTLAALNHPNIATVYGIELLGRRRSGRTFDWRRLETSPASIYRRTASISRRFS
jgi:serine/threonine protein kinase